MSDPRAATPIDDYLDDLLRRARTDPRTTRRLLDEAGDHLASTAVGLEASGMSRIDAEREAVRRLGPATTVTRGSGMCSLLALTGETLRAAVLLSGWGLMAVGLSGGVVAVMNALFGQPFVGGATVLGTGGSTVAETAQDAVALRVLAGVAGLLIVAGYALVRRHARPAVVLPRGLVDALGAAAFAAALAVLAGASVDQALTGVGGHGVGFFLSGAIVALVGAVAFGARASRALLPAH